MKPRRLFRYSLSTLLLVMLVVAAFLAVRLCTPSRPCYPESVLS